MTEKEITIQGKQYPVQFDLQTIMNWEEMNDGQSIFSDKFTSMKSRVALIMSAALSADPDTKLTVETILGNKDWEAAKEIIAAYNVVDSLASVFFKLTPGEKKEAEAEAAQQADTPEEERPKN